MDTEEEDGFELVIGDVDTDDNIDALCIDFAMYMKLCGNGAYDESSALIKLQWKRKDAPVRQISLSLVHKNDNSSADEELVQQIVKDNMALQDFAMAVYEEHKLRLTRIDYRPLKFVFEDCLHNDHHAGLHSTAFKALVKQFLVKGLKNKNEKLELKFKINKREIESHDGNHLTPTGGDMEMRSNAGFEGLFTEIEKEFRDQMEYFEQKLAEQQRKNDNLSQAVNEITELQRKLQAIEHSKAKELEGQNQIHPIDDVKTTSQGDDIQKFQGDSALENSLLNKSEVQEDSGSWEKIPKSAENDTDTNNQATAFVNNGEDKNGGNKKWKLSDTKKDSRTEKVGFADKFVHELEDSGEEPFTNDFYTTDSQYETTRRDTYGKTTNVPGFDDDYYHDDMSMQNYGMQDEMSKNSYSPTHTCQLHSSKAYSHLQPVAYNFDVEKIEKIAGISSEGPSEVRKIKIWEGQSGGQKLRLLLEILIRNQILQDRLTESVEDAMLDEESPVPRATDGLDTVLCLDTSDSMEGEAFSKLKQIATSFIDGVEKIAEEQNIEENIALVTFGGKARVLHHLSNDYSSLKEAVDGMKTCGPSPIMEGLMVGLACLSKGGILQVDNLKQPPRLFFLTDGHATPELSELGADDPSIAVEDQIRITSVFKKLQVGQMDDGIPHPIIFVPVGTDVGMACLTTLSSACSGEIADAEKFQKMSKFQWFFRIAGDALKYMRLNKSAFGTIQQSWFPDLLSQLGFELSSEDAREVFAIAEKNIQASLCDDGSICNFFNVHEYPELPPLGSRVIRGPDWRWGNQDTEGPGTIINHSPSGAVYVRWDNEHINVYRYGYKDRYDVQLTDLPRILEGCAPAIGAQVERGPDWRYRYGDQDSGRGHYGMVIRMGHNGTILVRWQNGEMYEYRSGLNGKYDVSVRDVPVSSGLPTKESLEVVEVQRKEEVLPPHAPTSKDGPHVWQREVKDNTWEEYSTEEAEKIKNVFLKNPTGTCLVQRNGQSFRISFKTMKERRLIDGTTVAVRQQFL